MRLVDLLPRGSFIADLTSTTKKEVLQEMVNLLVKQRRLPASRAAGAVEALMARETLGSTGVGRGVAVPHATCEGLKGIIGAAGLSRRGIEFHALDGRPVDLVFLILSAPGSPERLEALKRISQFVMEQDLCRFLRQAKDDDTVQELLEEAESRLRV